ncbi:MobH family relaxase [Salmonella enterica]|nr:TraI domain-containing protein [Salmonella enterica]
MNTGIHAKLKWLTGKMSQKKDAIPAVTVPPPNPGWMTPQSAEILLNTPFRQQLIKIIWQRTSLSELLFTKLYHVPISRFAELVQQLPASEYHHHAYPGGLLDHSLEVMAFAAKLRQRHLLPAGAAPEDQAREAEAWTAGIIYAAMLHDVGKIVADMEVITEDNQRWSPWMGPLKQPYRLKYCKNRNYALHPVAASLFTTRLLPTTALNWLVQYRELYESFLFCISGHYDRAGILGELVQEADRASVAQFMGANASQALERAQPSLPRQILTALRELVQTQFKLSNPNSGSDGWLTEGALWLISKTTADRIRAWLLQQGVTSVPDNNTRLFDEMQAHGLLIPTPEGKAVWTCKITADSGWTPGCPLTLLRLSPARLWPPPTDHPASFAGQVTPVTITSNQQGATADADIEHTDNSSPTTTSETDLVDLTFSLFAPEDVHAGRNPQNIITETENETVFFPAEPQKTSGSPEHNDSEKMVADSHLIVRESPVFPDESGFIIWLREGIRTHKIAVNDAQARVHMVEGKVFLVSPEIFKLYIKTTSGKTGDEWKLAQKSFQKLKIHCRDNEGINIYTCEVRGPRKTRKVKGYLLDNPELIFGNTIPEDNPYLSVINNFFNSDN